MFNHECSQRLGEVVGACMDGFLFGTCCQLPGSIPQQSSQQGSSVLKEKPSSNSAAALSYEKFGSQLNNLNYNNGVFYNQVKLEENPTKDYNNINNDNDKYSASIKPFIKDQNYYGSNDNNYDLENDVNANGNYQNNNNKLNANQYDVPSDAVVVYSPSSGHYDVNKGSTYYPVSSTTEYLKGDPYLPPSPSQSYSQEIPSLLNTYDSSYVNAATATEANADYTSASGAGYLSNTILQDEDKFDHSDISHPGADAILLSENGTEIHDYAEPSNFTPPEIHIDKESKTEKPIRVTYPKPQFKPKPTQANDPNSYILVHTIQSENKYNETQTKPTVPTNNIPSIETIILMLNDSQHGPQYDTDQTTLKTTSVYPYPTTSSINYDKYGPSSFYVTNKLTPTKTPFSTTQSQSPSNYIYSNAPTKSPSTLSNNYSPSTSVYSGSSTYGSTSFDGPIPYPSTTLQPPQKSKKPSKSPTKTPSKTTVVNKTPSTSYVYSPNPTKRPTTATTTTTTTIITSDGTKPVRKTTSKRPAQNNNNNSNNYGSTTSTKLPEYIIQSKPIGQQQQQPIKIGINENYIQIASASDNPSPTVLITPKPTANIVTSSTWINNNNKISSPSYLVSQVVTQRPQINIVSTPGYGPSLNDFEGEGYFGITHRPAAVEHTVSSTAYYTIVDNNAINNNNNNYGSSPTYSYGVSPPSYNPPPPYGISSFLSPGPSPVTPTFDSSNTVKIEVYETSTNKDEVHTSPDDLNNFPPVRNPNLNMTGGAGGIHDDELEISTPSFIDDDLLKNKMDLLVSKIVASLQDNFESLADTITETKNVTVLKDPNSNSTAKPTPVKQRPGTLNNATRPTRRPAKPAQQTSTQQSDAAQSKPTKRPTARPATGSTKPSNTNVRPTPGNKPSKPVNQINTGSDTKPIVVKTNTTRPANTVTTKRPIRRPSAPTKKPASESPITTRRPVKVIYYFHLSLQSSHSHVHTTSTSFCLL